MLWNVVYEFFVKYIFGGYWGDQLYLAYIGNVFAYDNGTLDDNFIASTGQIDVFNFYDINDVGNYSLHLSLGNYLSLIATIISMVIILVICCALIKKIYNMCAHIIG